MNKENVRAAAATLLTKLETEKLSLSLLLEDKQECSDASMLRELSFGCCRWFQQLDFLLSCLLEKPLRTKDRDLHWLLIVGLYQLRQLSLPDHAVLNETVAATVVLNKPWAKGLLNGVLRNYLRNKESLQQKIDDAGATVKYSHPAWLTERLEQQWPQQYCDILQGNNQRPPLTLRVNKRRIRRDGYLQSLDAAGIAASPGSLAESAVYLDAPMAVTHIPGFAEGHFSVQDEASQLVPGLLDLKPGHKVLDACAAPGGKTTHILESEGSLTSCVAIDKDVSRLDRVEQNLSRLGLKADIKAADVTDRDSWWDGNAFDRILLDAPCTAVGVIRRHPDIKLLRDASSLISQPKLQRKLLDGLWPTLASGGLLLYTTCSVLREENEQVIEGFVTSTDNVKYEGITAEWGVKCQYGRQLLPATGIGTDGFYFCLLRKT